MAILFESQRSHFSLRVWAALLRNHPEAGLMSFFASFAVLCELCAKGIRSRKRDTLAQSSQRTAKLAKLNPSSDSVPAVSSCYRLANTSMVTPWPPLFPANEHHK